MTPTPAGGVKRDTFWNGYEVHLSETCDQPEVGGDADTAGAAAGQQGQAPPAGELPNLITGVATTDATVADQAMTQPIHRQLAGRGLLPGEHYVDSGTLSRADRRRTGHLRHRVDHPRAARH